MAALVTGNQATASVIERGLNDADAEVRRFAAAAAATDARDRRSRRAAQDRAGRQGAARPPRSAARLGPAFAEDVVRAGSRRAEGCRTRTCSCRRSISSAHACPAERICRRRSDRDRRLARTPRRAPGTRRRTRSCRWRASSRTRRARRCRGSCSTRPGRCGCMPRAPPACWRAIDASHHADGAIRNDNVREAALSVADRSEAARSRRRRRSRR